MMAKITAKLDACKSKQGYAKKMCVDPKKYRKGVQEVPKGVQADPKKYRATTSTSTTTTTTTTVGPSCADPMD